MRHPLLTALSVACLLASAAAQQKRAFEVADAYGAPRVSSPVLSPDGEHVAYTVGHYDLDGGKTWSHLWMMRADGSEARQLTHGEGSVGSLMFTPDGERLLFSASRGDDGQQLHALPLAGGEARALTKWPAGFSSPVLSPDGKLLAVAVETYVDCGADGDCIEKRDKARAEGKTKVHVADELLYRHWTSWRDGKYTHVLLFDAETGEALRDLTPGAFDSPTFSLGGDPGFVFSPDSKQLCFVSNRDEHPAESTNADLWLVPVEGGEARNLTADSRGWDGAPAFSPDGKHIAFISQQMPGYESDLRRLSVLNLASGEVRRLTTRETFDDMVDGMTWSEDGSALFFQAERKGRNPLFRIALDSGEITELHTHATIGGWELTPNDGAIVYSSRSISEPTEIYRVAATGGEPTRLTTHTQPFRDEVDCRPAEELWIDSGEGYDVHAFVVKPHGFQEGQRYPAVLNVHGGPQGQWMDSFRGDWQVYPGKGYVVVFANPTGSTGYGQALTDGIACDWGGRVYRDLMKVVDTMETLDFIDPERIGVMGWSYGGYMTMWMQGQTDRFACIASMMGLYDMRSFYGATEELWFPEKDLCGQPWNSDEYERWSPSNHVANFSTPALVIGGELDYRVPYTQSLQYFTALQKMGVPSRLVMYPNAGHWPAWHEMVFYYNAHLDFFHEYLGGEPAPWDVHEFAAQGAPPKPEDTADPVEAAASR